MKSIKVLAMSMCLFVFQNAKAQADLKTGTYENGDKLIYISLINLVKIVQMTNVEFEKTMENIEQLNVTNTPNFLLLSRFWVW